MPLVVNVATDVTGEITTIAVTGRPPHAFGGIEGLHTTAWAVLPDVVRRQLIGEDMHDAAEQLSKLVDDMVNRAWYKGSRLLPHGARRTAFEAAVAAARTAITAVGNAINDDGRRASLQTAITQYLNARNLAPMSNVNLGAAQAVGDAEGAARRVVCAEESSEKGEFNVEDVRTALWGLLDPRTIAHAASDDCDDVNMPGQHGSRRTRVADVIRRHLREVSLAYPLAYRRARLDDPDVVKDLYEATTVEFDDVEFPDLPDGLQGPDRRDDVDPAPAGWSDANPIGTGVAVGLFISMPNGTPTVQSVLVAGRGPTLLDSNQQGHHLTAHIAVVMAVKRALVGKSLDDARTALLALARNVVNLQTYPEDVDLDGEDRNHVFATARELLDEAIEDLDDADDNDLIGPMQDCAAAYVALRNAMPLAACAIGAPSNNRGEAQMVLLLNRAEQRRRTGDEVVAAMWGLLDSDAVDFVSQQMDSHDAPGAAKSELGRLADAISVHLATLEDAWPLTFARVKPRSYKQIDKFVRTKVGMRVSMVALLEAIDGMPNDELKAARNAAKVELKRTASATNVRGASKLQKRKSMKKAIERIGNFFGNNES